MKTITCITVLIYTSLFALTATRAEQAAVKIHVHITDDEGNPVEGAVIKFISEFKGSSERKGSEKHSNNKKSPKTSKTDARGVAVVSCPGRYRVVGKDVPRKLISIRGEFLVTTRKLGSHKRPYRTFCLPQRVNGGKSILKLILKK